MRIAVVAVAFIVGAVASGCTLINPYVKPAANGLFDKPGQAYQDPTTGNIELRKAFRDADRLSLAYYEGVSDQARAKNWLAATIIPLTGLALFTGATRPADGSDLIPAIGFGSAAALGTASFFNSPQRQDVYLAGMKAIACAKTAVIPFDYSQQMYDEHLGPNSTLRTKSKALRVALGGLPASSTGDWRTAADMALANADAAAADAERYKTLADRAGARLRERLEFINAQVAEQVRRTEPDIAGIRGIISATNLGSTLPLPTPESIKTQGNSGAAAAPANILVLTADVIAATNSTRSAVGDLSNTNTAALDACKPADATLALKAEPSTVQLAAGDQFDINVIAQAGAPSASVVGSWAADITVTIEPVRENRNGWRVRLQTASSAHAGERRLIISTYDNTQSVSVAVTVTAPAAPAPVANDLPSAADQERILGFFKGPDKTKPASNTEIAAYATLHNQLPSAGGKIPDSSVAIMKEALDIEKKSAPPKAGEKSLDDFELAWASNAHLKALLKAKGLAEDKKGLDADVRAKLEAGRLTQDQWKKIQPAAPTADGNN